MNFSLFLFHFLHTVPFRPSLQLTWKYILKYTYLTWQCWIFCSASTCVTRSFSNIPKNSNHPYCCVVISATGVAVLVWKSHHFCLSRCLGFAISHSQNILKLFSPPSLGKKFSLAAASPQGRSTLIFGFPWFFGLFVRI